VELFLPQADGAIVEEVSETPDTAKFVISRDKETILIVDDEPQVRAMILRIFEREGFKVLMAENGIEALETLDRHADDIHLIILDMTMPHMGGKETIERIRKQNSDIPVLLSSGYTLNQEIQELIKQPHTYFIHKPYRRATILETVQQIFAKSFRFSDQ
jgi:CheY-like chemotaxis protein